MSKSKPNKTVPPTSAPRLRPMPFPRSDEERAEAVRRAEAELTMHAATVSRQRAAQDCEWGSRGWTRRRFIAGFGMAGAASLAVQRVSMRTAFAAPAQTSADGSGVNTVILVFLRGAADGLRILVPSAPSLGGDYLRAQRGALVPADSELIALPSQGGWAVNAALRPLYDQLWSSGELAFVPAVSNPAITRSHFQAQQLLEQGGLASATSGWLDRVLPQLGPGTTFRATSVGGPSPMSMLGPEPTLAMNTLKAFTFPGWDGIRPQTEQALTDLYRGIDGPLGVSVAQTMASLTAAASAQNASAVANGAVYPTGQVGQAFADLAAMLRAEVGLQVATVDVGGWDTHTDEVHDLDASLTMLSQALSAFMTDLGPARRSRVTLAVMTEFGRRVEMNASGGSDHGHGSVMWLLGGGLAGSKVAGSWSPLSDAVLDQGDVPGMNSPFSVLGEVVSRRLGAGSLSTVFPGQSLTTLGIASS